MNEADGPNGLRNERSSPWSPASLIALWKNCPHIFSGSYEFCDQNVTDSLVDYLPSVFSDAPKSYSFIYLGNVDDTGHFSLGGWCGSQYSDAVAAADLQVRNICNWSRANPVGSSQNSGCENFLFSFCKSFGRKSEKNSPHSLCTGAKLQRALHLVPREWNAF